MDTEKCKVLLKTLEHGSLSTASTALGYTPSGISYIIDSIEKSLDIKIVERKQSGIELTEDGKELLPYFDALIDADEQLQSKARIMSNSERQKTIVIGLYPSIARLVMVDIIQRYQNIHPDINFILREGINYEFVNPLRNNEYDFCICTHELFPSYDFIPVFQDEWVCVLPKSHKLSNKERLQVRDIADEDFIATGYGQDIDVLNFEREIDLVPRVVHTSYDNQTAFNMVKHNMGISIINKLGTVGITDGCDVKGFTAGYTSTIGVVVKRLDRVSDDVADAIDYVVKQIPNCGLIERRMICAI